MVRRLMHIFLLLLVTISLLVLGADARGGSYTATREQYVIPDVTLINQDGVKTKLRDALLSDKPVLVDFVYTTCTTICPVLSANFANFQRSLGPAAADVRLISISIDPENDGPKTLKSYLKRFGAKPGWEFLTGARTDIEKTLTSLNAYTPNKMNHTPLILMRKPGSGHWVRIYGLIGTTDLIKEYERTTL